MAHLPQEPLALLPVTEGTSRCISQAANNMHNQSSTEDYKQDRTFTQGSRDEKVRAEIEKAEAMIASLQVELSQLEGIPPFHPRMRGMGVFHSSTGGQMLDKHRLYYEIKYLQDYIHTLKNSTCVTEGADEGDLASGQVADSVVKENVIEISGDSMTEEKAISGEIFGTFPSDNLDLDSFLSRPIQFAEFALDSAIVPVPVRTYDVWDLYTLEPSIRAKIRNYELARFDLEVTVDITGMPFMRGKVLVSYVPFGFENVILNSLSGATQRQHLLRYLSQSRYAKVIDVRKNKTLSMILPYISPQPMARTYNPGSSSLAAGTSMLDFKRLGQLFVIELTPLTTVSDNDTNAYVQLQYRAINVKMAVPTRTSIVVATEGKQAKGGGADERKTGPVEKFSSAASAVMGMLSQVPIIGPYAQASSIAIGGMSKAASLLGWSYPTVTSEPHRFRPEPFANAAPTIGMDTGHRLTIDPLQQLSVDPRICASEADEMSLAYIAQRESYLDSFTWDPAADPREDVLWSIGVNPLASKRLSDGLCVPTAASFAVAPFVYWNGKVHYRFEAVVSSFDRGKLLINFEPNVALGSAVGVTLNTLNENNLVIWDLQQTQDLEIVVDWAKQRPWLKVGTSDQAHLPLTTIGREDYHNGFVYVQPFTALQNPNNSSITINVYTWVEDLQVAVPQDDGLPLVLEVPALATTEGLMEDTVTTLTVNPNKFDGADLTQHYFGERVMSFRSLMKRFFQSASGTQFLSETGQYTNVSVQSFAYPDPVPTYGSTSTSTNLYSYLRYAYLGVRGGVRKRIYFWGGQDGESFAKVRLGAANFYGTPGISWSIDTVGQPDDGSKLRATTTFACNVNNGIEVEIPFYSNNLFMYSQGTSLYPNNTNWNDYAVHTYDYVTSINLNSNRDGFFMEETASAEDFSFLHFVAGVPHYIP